MEGTSAGDPEEGEHVKCVRQIPSLKGRILRTFWVLIGSNKSITVCEPSDAMMGNQAKPCGI